MSSWSFGYLGYEPEAEGLREALLTLGNGYMATRGAAQESVADTVHYPGTYLAGAYDRQISEIAGHQVENEDLVNMPNWLPLTFRLEDGPWFSLQRVDVLDYRQRLDMRNGILERRVRFRDDGDRTSRLVDRRIVSITDPHLMGTATQLWPEDWTGNVEIRSGLDGRVVNAGVARYGALTRSHLDTLDAFETPDGLLGLKVRTRQSDLRLAMTARTTLWGGGELVQRGRVFDQEDGNVAQRVRVAAAPEHPLDIEKIVSVYSSRDNATSEAGHQSVLAARRAPCFAALAAAQKQAYGPRWRRHGLHLHGPDGTPHGAMRTLRLHLFHLMQTVSRHTTDLDVGVPARGWHGEAYRGHIFWDELFILPLLNLSAPEISRALLKYRVRRLGEAKAAAHAAGYEGAMFPWQSGSDGREESQAVHLNPRSGAWVPDNTYLQRHVASAVAYNIWRYFEATGDIEFLAYHGAETFLEIARFWVSRAEHDEALDRYVIRGVVGPDEYHDAYPGTDRPGIDDNAYTNVMAAWVLQTVPHLLGSLPEARQQDLLRSMGLDEATLDGWEDLARRLYVPVHGGGILSQFRGYHDLLPFDWAAYRKKYGNIQRLDRILEAEGDSTNRYQVSKQADVTMLFYLFPMEELRDILTKLGHSFDEDQLVRNIDHYLQRSAHGSTLSNVVHSWVLTRHDSTRSWALFLEALRSDVEDVQGGTTHEGIHLGAMAGTADIAYHAYPGLQTRGGRLLFDPRLPTELAEVAIPVHFRGHDLVVTAAHDTVTVLSRPSRLDPIEVVVGGERQSIAPGQRHTFSLVGR